MTVEVSMCFKYGDTVSRRFVETVCETNMDDAVNLAIWKAERNHPEYLEWEAVDIEKKVVPQPLYGFASYGALCAFFRCFGVTRDVQLKWEEEGTLQENINMLIGVSA